MTAAEMAEQSADEAGSSIASGEKAEHKRALREALEDTSTEAVELGFGELSFDEDGPLLPQGHPLREAEEATEVAYGADDVSSAAQQAAAAAFGHHVDGWSYLGESISALGAGEISIARHLAYYAELRFAFSILARHGIIVRSLSHVVLGADGAVFSSGPLPTHEAVWLIFKQWMTSKQAQELFLDGTLFGGEPLRSWYAELEVSPGESMADILRQVGYDLALYEKDRAARNSASYGARWMREGSTSTLSLLEDLQRIWSFVEPVGNSGFDAFDAEFAGILLARARLKSQRSIQPKKYMEDARRITNRIGALSPESTALKLVTTAKGGGQDEFLRAAFAADSKPRTGVEQTRGMIGRAFVLGRYASAALRDLLVKAAVDDEELGPRVRSIGEISGLWADRHDPVYRLGLVKEYREHVARIGGAADLTETRTLRSFELDIARRLPLISTWFLRDLESPLPVS